MFYIYLRILGDKSLAESNLITLAQLVIHSRQDLLEQVWFKIWNLFKMHYNNGEESVLIYVDCLVQVIMCITLIKHYFYFKSNFNYCKMK